MSLSFPLTLTDRFAFMMRALREAVAARIKCPPVTAEIIVFVCARLRGIARAFERLAGQIRAGTYVVRPAGKRRAGGAGSRRGVSIVMSHYTLGLPPWAPAWLHRIAPGDAGVWAGALRQLLSEPEMAAVIAAAPRMRRILQPLCFMLGVEASLLKPVPANSAVAVADDDAVPVSPGTHVVATWEPGAADPAPPVTMAFIPERPGGMFRCA